jgi:transcriptional regulator with XRE-family HTH domain
MCGFFKFAPPWRRLGNLCMDVSHTNVVDVDPIAELAHREMQQRGMTISDLAIRTGVERNTLGRWLSGKRSIRLSQALLVMSLLRIVVLPERLVHGQVVTPTRMPDRPKPR